jgi:hypothetical protein
MIFSSPYFLFLALIAPVFSSYVYAIPFSSIAAESAVDSDSEDSEAVEYNLADGKPIAFVLTGDSTTAKGGGWGQWLRMKAVPSTDIYSR